jgi:hypothetical protein
MKRPGLTIWLSSPSLLRGLFSNWPGAWLVTFLLALAHVADAQRLPDDFNPERAEREGRELVALLLSQVPVDDYTNSGKLCIRPRGGEPRELPVTFLLQVDGNRWVSVFEATSDQTNQLNGFTILSQAGQPNRYYRGHPREADSLTPLTLEEAATLSFAGSDFTVGDLGLEFLRWPVQRLLKKEMRRSQSCNVLESIHTNAPSGSYSRVVSWLDIDTGGIVIAEAFDSDRKRVKEFMPKSIKQVGGEYQLREMEIEDFRNRSRTSIIFDLPVE